MLHTHEKERTMAPCNDVDESHIVLKKEARHKRIQTECLRLHKVQEQANYSTVIEVTIGLIFGRECKLTKDSCRKRSIP